MNWLSGMNVVINYIENNLTNDINISSLAKILCCSEYEFQRLFSFIVDIPLSEYITRRRLSLAANDVQNSDEKIINIAVKYGYESHSSFSRAFKRMFGLTPTEARRKKDIPLSHYPRFALLLTIGATNTMEHRILELPPAKMARSGNHAIEEFGKWWPKIAQQEKGLMFPKDFWWNNEKTGRPEWIYAIPEWLTDTNGYEVFDYPGGLYAVTTAYDEEEEKSKATSALIKWIQESDCFELANDKNDPTYHSRYGMGHISSPKGVRPEFTIFLPIVKK